jgi:hypothetical protein
MADGAAFFATGAGIGRYATCPLDVYLYTTTDWQTHMENGYGGSWKTKSYFNYSDGTYNRAGYFALNTNSATDYILYGANQAVGGVFILDGTGKLTMSQYGTGIVHSSSVGALTSSALTAAECAAAVANGTTNTIAMYTAQNTIGNSPITTNGGLIGIGGVPSLGLLHLRYDDSQYASVFGNTTGVLALQNKGSAHFGYEFDIKWMSATNDAFAGIGAIYTAYVDQAGADLVFGTRSGNSSGGTGISERMRITNGGFVGIGTVSPADKLTIRTVPDDANVISGTASITSGHSYGLSLLAGTTSSDRCAQFYNAGGTTPYLYIRGDGNVGIGTASPNATLTVKGNFSDTGTVYISTLGTGTVMATSGVLSSVSDERKKKIKGNFIRSIDAIMPIQPIIYNWNKISGLDTTVTMAGFSAQNVQKSIPEAVSQDRNGFLSLSDRALLATAINAIREQQSEIQELKNQVRILIDNAPVPTIKNNWR